MTGTIKVSRVESLWTNPSPSNQFTAQDISIANLSEYNLIAIVYSVSGGDTGKTVQVVNYVEGLTVTLFAAYTPASGASSLCKRSFVIRPTKIEMNAANENFVNATTRVTNNNRCVPVEVYGIKL